MTTLLRRPSRRGIALSLILMGASAATAQRFVWPPAAGDRMAQAPANQPLGDQPTGNQPASDQPLVENQPLDNGTLWGPPPTVPAAADPAAAEEPLNVAARPTTASASQSFPAFGALAAGGATQWKILENPNGPHTALVFDPVRQVFAVYHVDAASGQIMLKSVRNLSADLQLPQFNSSNPAPKDIQGMLNEAR